jgi:membrane protease YdiL (CAAX protease family)
MGRASRPALTQSLSPVVFYRCIWTKEIVGAKVRNVRNLRVLNTVVLFLAGGGLIGSAAFVSFIPQDMRMILKVTMAVISLVAWLAFRPSERYRQYSQIALGFFAVSLGVLLAQFFGNIPLGLLGFSVATVQGVAVAKFGEALPIVLSILVLHFATGGDMNGLFLQVGNLKLGLIAGITGFAAFTGISVLQAIGSGLKWESVTAALPWILIFIFSNALMEELWFRALFLKKLAPVVGGRTSLILTSLVFAGVHISSTYVIDILLFVVGLMALSLLWGWLMQKTNSIWGPVLIHAGGDILVILGFLAGADL